MQAQSLRPSIALANHLYSARTRRAAFDLCKQPGLRPLHASPIFQNPRRRDFFSSNAALHNQKTHNDSAPDGGKASAQTQNRKTARPSGGKDITTSSSCLRHSALRMASSPGPQLRLTRLLYPRAVTAYAVAETFDTTKVVEILRSKGYEPDPLGTGLYPQVVHIQIPISSVYRSSKVSIEELSPSDIGDVFIFPSGTLVTWGIARRLHILFRNEDPLTSSPEPTHRAHRDGRPRIHRRSQPRNLLHQG